MLTDCHVHLEMFSPAEREEIVERARQGGLVIIITSGVTVESSLEAIKLANTYDIVYAAVGIHPSRVTGILDDETYGTLRDLAMENEKVVAISETGLDFSGNRTNRDEQIQVFRQHIRLAREVNKPLIIHRVEAHEDVIQVLKEEKAGEVGGAIHYFEESLAEARDFLDVGFYISLGRVIAKPESEALRQIAKDIPIDRILLETDASPHYSSRPANVLQVAETLARVKGLSLGDVEQVTTENLRRLIGVW